MKKKIGYLALYLLVTFIFSKDVYAAGEITLSYTLPSVDIVEGSVAPISFYLETTDTTGISSCTFTATPGSDIEFSSVNGANNWQAINKENNYTISTNSDNVLKSGDTKKLIFELKYKVNKSSNVVIGNVSCSNGVSSFTQTDMTVTLTAKSVAVDTSLKSLTVTNGTLEGGGLTAGVRTYSINLTNADFSIVATATNPDFQDKIVFKDSNNNTLDPTKLIFSDPSYQGSMLITIIVNGDTENKYEIVVHYGENASTYDGSLKSLSINGVAINLIKGKFDYGFTVGNNVTSFVVNAVINDTENFEFASVERPGTFGIGSEPTVVALVINPKSTVIGAKAVSYTILVKRDETVLPSSSSSAVSNPQTSDISSFVMAFIIVASLIASIVLYKKNIEQYN